MNRVEISVCSLTLILLQQLFVYGSKSPFGGAYLLIELVYTNPSSRLQNGEYCDRIGSRECDVFFTLCLSNAAAHRVRRSTDECLLYKHTTQYFKNTNAVELIGERALEVFVPPPVPNLLRFSVEIFDHDVFRQELIALYQDNTITLKPTEEVTPIPMPRIGGYINSDVTLQVRMTMRCVNEYYGDHCIIHCKADPLRYHCRSDGGRTCLPGRRGVLCDLEDSCHYEPCASHATCVNNDYKAGRRCVCDGHEGPECYPHYDPCAISPCDHGGICAPSGSYNASFTCKCTPPWTGHRCNEKRSACAEEAEALRLNRTLDEINNETSVIPVEVCLNGGTCFEHPDKFEVRCVCSSVWTGNRCQVPISSSSSQRKIIIGLMGLIGFFCITFTAVLGAYCIKRELRKRRYAFNEHKGALVYFRQNGESPGNSALLDNQITNEIYINNRYPFNWAPLQNNSNDTTYADADIGGPYEIVSAHTTIYEETKKPEMRNSSFHNYTLVSKSGRCISEERPPALPQRPSNLITFSSPDRLSRETLPKSPAGYS